MYTLFYKEILHFWGKNDNKGVKQAKGSGKKNKNKEVCFEKLTV